MKNAIEFHSIDSGGDSMNIVRSHKDANSSSNLIGKAAKTPDFLFPILRINKHSPLKRF
jgi:hypothetical protein